MLKKITHNNQLQAIIISSWVKLSAKIGYPLSTYQEKKYSYKEKITDSENSFLIERLEKEYLFIEKVKNLIWTTHL